MSTRSNPYRGLCCPAGNTNQVDLLCHCLSLNPRDVELIPVARGVMVSYETVANGDCSLDGPTPTASSDESRSWTVQLGMSAFLNCSKPERE
jgi:hypothetical protein